MELSEIQKIMSTAARTGDKNTLAITQALVSLYNDMGTGSINEVTALGLDQNLGFNVNVIEAGYTGNPEIRLPYPPVKGKTATVINNTPDFINVYPSIVGGSINGEVDAFGAVPPDGKPYTFYCWENPLPGAWTWTPPAQNQYVSTVLTVPHTTGTVSNYVGSQSFISGAWGGGHSGGNLTLTPASSYWFTFPGVVRKALKLKVYTNIAASEVNETTKTVACFRVFSQMTGPSSAATSQAEGFLFGPQSSEGIDFQIKTIGSGAISSPLNLGDAGTIYAETTITPFWFSNLLDIGLGNFSQVYSIFGASVSAGMATKDYKFQFFLEYN